MRSSKEVGERVNKLKDNIFTGYPIKLNGKDNH